MASGGASAPRAGLALYPTGPGAAGRAGARGCTCERSPRRPPNISELSIPFPSSPLARIALGSLAPDPEPRKGGISKELSVTENVLHVGWKAEEARILRVSISSFLEHLSLVVETMELFGPPVA
uniref:EKC/KEOPS complex subunit LAGE3 n=1 Tax=Euleptes europaea TaxID=460621 RepID=UPI0025417220|nr:EKC/KEOPS complex subunit LAGE3 [Euleptes europaea]